MIAGTFEEHGRAFLKEDPKLQKAIGLITCASVMAVSLYLFSGGDPSRTLSARTESGNGDRYGAVARRFLQDAREQAQRGHYSEARRLAETAASLDTEWTDAEQTPEEFLKALDRRQASAGSFAVADEVSAEETTTEEAASEEENPFAEAAEEQAAGEPVGSSDLLRKKQAQRLIKEARAAMAEGDTALARSRALQARQLNASWGLWDDRPEHVLADLDARTSTSTFVAGGRQQPAAPEIRSKESEQAYQQATALLKRARAAMDANKLSEAQQLADEAAACGAAFGIFDDSPEVVSRDIRRLQGTKSAANETFAAATEDSSPQTAEARTLLREARAAMAQGRLSAAREKAEQAAGLNVSYNVLDDRPELVLSDIDNALRGQSRTSAPAETDSIAASTGTSGDAAELVSRARAALDSGDYQSARELAMQAQNQDAAFGLLEDRPELVLEEAHLMAQRDSQRDSNQAIASRTSTVPTESAADENPFSAGVSPAGFNGAEFGVVGAGNESAATAYRRGIALFRSGDRSAARAAFQSAWKNAGELSGPERRQLQDFLQALATSPEADVQLASAQEEAPAGVSGADLTLPPEEAPQEKDPLTIATEASDVRYDRLRTEVMNSVFRAEKLKNDNPDEALQILDNTLATVEAAPLNKESLETLAGYVRRSQDSIRAFKEQQAPRFALKEKNDRTMETIKRQEEAKIRIEQEFAELTEQFNQLYKERRYAEAELVAKKARDLNPELPQATIMIEKARIQKQVAFNEDVRERKADSFNEQLNEVELAAIKGADYELPRSWGDLTKRRERFGAADQRKRTESELQIEKSLGEKVSLHFHDVPLTDIIRHIATVHGINIAMKTRAIETEGLSASQPVTIDVDGITLASALNLLLEQAGGLVYAVENETLMITNRMEQETRYEPRAYNVADLVVPLGAKVDARSLGFGGMATSMGMNTQPATGSGLYQVDDQLAVNINGSGRTNSGSAPGTLGAPDFNGLIDLLTTTVEPGSWDLDGGNGKISVDENTLSLVIRQTAAVHEQIADLLQQLRKLQDLQVTVEVRFISVSDSFFERIGVDFDFNVQDTLGDPPGVPAFGSRQLTFPGGQQGGQGGGGGQANQGGDLRGNQQQQGGGQQGGGQQGQQGQQGAGQRLFDRVNRVNSPRDDFNGQTVGLRSPNQFTEDYDIEFRQGSFEIGVPDFGGFQPNAGIQVGMAILSDIEAFFFIQAAQGDQRSNLMFAPKVTMYNGQQASINDTTTRYLVIGQIPNVAPGAVGFQPIIAPFNDGIQLFVSGVVSADRRYVRLSVTPFFNQIIDVQTFTNVNAGGAGFGGGGGQGGGGFGGGGGGFGGGGGGGGGQFGFGGIGGGFGGGGGGGGFGGGGGGGQQGQQGQQGGGGQAGTVQLPVISQFSVSTVVSVPDGGTILLGGVKRLKEGRNMAGVPILNKIPYISRLFKNSGVGRETESIMLMVTPRIIIQEEEEELIIGTAAE